MSEPTQPASSQEEAAPPVQPLTPGRETSEGKQANQTKLLGLVLLAVGAILQWRGIGDDLGEVLMAVGGSLAGLAVSSYAISRGIAKGRRS